MDKSRVVYLNIIFKGQEIIMNGTNKTLLSADEVHSVSKGFINTESSFATKYKSREYGRRDRNLALFKNTVWLSDAIDRENNSQYQYKNQLKSAESSMRKLREESMGMNLERVSSKTMQAVSQNISKKIAPNDTIYLYENRPSKCVIN